jgi:hypothetical protein
VLSGDNLWGNTWERGIKMKLTYNKICEIIENKYAIGATLKIADNLDSSHIHLGFSFSKAIAEILKWSKGDKSRHAFEELKQLNMSHFKLMFIFIQKSKRSIHGDYSNNFIKTVLNKIKLSNLEIATFIILHEYGHVFELQQKFSDNVGQLVTDVLIHSRYLNKKNLTREEWFLQHKLNDHEKFADSFAAAHFSEIFTEILGLDRTLIFYDEVIHTPSLKAVYYEGIVTKI